jgi:hypothetical protein
MSALRRDLRWASGALLLGGVLSLIGSFQTWAICPDTSCGRDELAFFVLVDRSGVEWGEGVLTAFLGAAITLIGLWSLRSRTPKMARLASWLGLTVVVVVAVNVIRLHVLPGPRFYGPEVGVLIVAGGGLLATVAGRWGPSRTEPA